MFPHALNVCDKVLPRFHHVSLPVNIVSPCLGKNIDIPNVFQILLCLFVLVSEIIRIISIHSTARRYVEVVLEPLIKP